MARIPEETVNKIIDAIDIVDVVGDFVSLKRRGANYIACCPFHNEKTPSFYVSPSKGIYKCFGCGKSGSAISFVMEHESLSYVEALEYLAGKYHIPVEREAEDPEYEQRRSLKESMMVVSEFAMKHFKANLLEGEGKNIGYQYFLSRGLEPATIEKYGLGWSMSSRHALIDDARANGYKEEYLVSTGLCIKREDRSGNGSNGASTSASAVNGTRSGEKIYDRFYERAMFPVHNETGRVIAFGGRTLRSDYKTIGIGKYVNSPESEIYDKSRTLYGLYFAKSAISREDNCILVEGYLDVLSMHQLGITNVVASSGTSLTVPQIKLIKRYTSNVTIIYDGDSAGIHAALRGIGLVLKEGLNVSVVLLPDGDDPDSYSRKHSLDEVRDFISEHRQDFIEFKTSLLLQEAGHDPLKRANLINDIADTIALIPDPIVRASYVKSSAARFEMDEQLLYDRANNSREKMIQADIKEEQLARQRAERMERIERESSSAANGDGRLSDSGASSNGSSSSGAFSGGNDSRFGGAASSSGSLSSSGAFSGGNDSRFGGGDGGASNGIGGDNRFGAGTFGLNGGEGYGTAAASSGGVSSGGFNGESPYGTSAGIQTAGPVVITNRQLAASERELLWFMLLYGFRQVKFDVDSPYYTETPQTVVDMIDSVLTDESNEMLFINPSYRKVYDIYIQMYYDTGLEERVLMERLRNSGDDEVRTVVMDILVDKHLLSIKNFENSIRTPDTMISKSLPWAIQNYQLERIKLQLADLQKAMLAEPDKLEEHSARFMELTRTKNLLSKKLGKV